MVPLLSLLLASPAAAAPHDDPMFEDPPPRVARVRRAGALGLGIGTGTHAAGFSARYRVHERFAVQGVLGAAVGRQQVERDPRLVEPDGGWQAGGALSVDALYEGVSFAEVDDFELGWCAGGGLGLWADGGAGASAAGVLGLELGFLTVPIELALEYRPKLRLLPDPAVDWFGIGGHLRWVL